MNTTGPNRILDEFAKLVTDAAGAAQGVRREVETAFRAQAERILNTMEVVQREEFEAAREMAVKARAENKALTARIETLETTLAALGSRLAELERTAGKIPGEDPIEEPAKRARRGTKSDPQK
jgi:BMFP domain-containing protein YqiC